MTEKNYQLLEHCMHRCMSDSAHDKEHVYRVLYNALQIAREEEGVNYDVLIAACLLHDIGRKAQFADPSVCHAQAGAQMAWAFLRENGFSAEFADRVRHWNYIERAEHKLTELDRLLEEAVANAEIIDL